MTEALDRLRESMAAKPPLIPFVGTGFLAAATSGATLASWRGLLLDGIDACDRVVPSLPRRWAARMKDRLTDADVVTTDAVADEIAQRLRAVREGREFDSWIRKAVGGLRPTPEGQRIIAAVRGLGSAIVTTNYDTLIEETEPRWSSYTWTDDEYKSGLRSSEVVLHLRGVAREARSIIFSSADYDRFSSDERAGAIDKSLFASRGFIFIGCGDGLRDPESAPLIAIVNYMLPRGRQEHFILVRGTQLRQFNEHPLSPQITPVAYGSSFHDLSPFLMRLAAGQDIEVSQDPGSYDRRIPDDSSADDQQAGREPAEPTAARLGQAQQEKIQQDTGTLVPGYSADTVDGPDELDITNDVNSLCSLLMAVDVKPPLSVGLFGDWGSGKSFFMQRMRERIDWITAESRASLDQGSPSDFCENVRQITFNAWHYVDANLWASLVTRIFDGLLGDTEDQVEPLTPVQREDQERHGRRLLTRLESAQVMAEEARRQRSLAEQRLKEKLQERAERSSKLDRLTALRATDVAAVAQHDPKKVADALGAVPETLRADIELLGQAHGIWRQLAKAWSKLGTTARWQTIGLILVSAALVGGGILLVRSGILGAVPLIAATIPLLGVVARWLPQVRRIRQDVELAARTVDQAVSRQQASLDAEIATATADIDAARSQLAAADIEIAEIQSGHRMSDFVAARASSSDYQRSLGLISVIRRDLARLSHLVSQPSADTQQAIERVVLYIDDLDRCPADRVAEVLQAVHLLLAFPLFIVVVGADARWLLRSLERHYADLITAERDTQIEEDPELALHWSATPQNYLDKIFQIPLSLRPMGSAGFDRLIRSTTGQSGPAAVSAGFAGGQAQDGGVSVTATGSSAQNAAGSSAREAASGAAESLANSGIEISLADLPEAAAVTQGSAPPQVAAASFIGKGHRLVLLGRNAQGDALITTLDARTGTQSSGDWTATGVTELSPDGLLVAVVSGSEVSLCEADNGHTVKVLPGEFSAAHFSVDGNWLIAIRSGGLTAVELAGHGQWKRDFALPADLRWLGVLPGRSRAIQVCSDGASTLDLGSGSPSATFEGAAEVFTCSPDGRLLATADADAVRIFDISTGRRRHLIRLSDVEALAINADGSMIAAEFRQHHDDSAKAPLAPLASIVVIETDTGRPIMKVESVGDTAFGPLAFSAAGHSLAAVGNRTVGSVSVWALATTATNLRSQQLQLTEPEMAFLGRLGPLVRTPRAAKRLVNVYRLLRAGLDPDQLAQLLGADAEPEFPAALLLLTIVTGFPDLAQEVIEGLLQAPDDAWTSFIGKYRRSSDQARPNTSDLLWRVLFERYDRIDTAGLPQQIDSYVRWAPLAARYSFRTGRLLG